jgi:para-aminobenzoate synthetase component 1
MEQMIRLKARMHRQETAGPVPAAPLIRTIPYMDPLKAFAPFADEPFAILLDCPKPDTQRSRYAYICLSPFATITAWGADIRVDGEIGDAPEGGNPWDVLNQLTHRFRSLPRPDMPPFQGGAVGMLGYELNRFVERLPSSPGTPLACPDMAVGLYDLIIAFDCFAQRAWIVSSGHPEALPADQQRRARRRADWLEHELGHLAALHPVMPRDNGARADVHAELDRADYLDRIRRVKDYIFAGDIYQANFTQRFLARKPSDLAPFALYRRLRDRSHAPFSAYMCIDPATRLLSVSPERFLKVDRHGRIETRPIKGTRPRHPDPTEDQRLGDELLASDKDRAENLMIVDLLRNDLSRSAQPGSVTVPALNVLESFETVHHLVSTVEARLAPGISPIELLRRAFPGGSITGAPKIRAMEIISELEAAPRGPYCGSAFWLDFSGGLDSNILIRTVVTAGDDIIIQAGGGIVADSDPEAEYEECLVKARAMIEAVQLTSAEPQP